MLGIRKREHDRENIGQFLQKFLFRIFAQNTDQNESAMLRLPIIAFKALNTQRHHFREDMFRTQTRRNIRKSHNYRSVKIFLTQTPFNEFHLFHITLIFQVLHRKLHQLLI